MKIKWTPDRRESDKPIFTEGEWQLPYVEECMDAQTLSALGKDGSKKGEVLG